MVAENIQPLFLFHDHQFYPLVTSQLWVVPVL